MEISEKLHSFIRKPLPDKWSAAKATIRTRHTAFVKNITECISHVAERGLERRGFIVIKPLASTYRSETSKCRHRLGPFCSGYGLDLGPGGDPINETAVRVDLPEPYGLAGPFRVQLGGDATSLTWFKDSTLDYVFSSHLLEDFTDTSKILIEWFRVLKIGGRLVLFCPDEQVYRTHCALVELLPNSNHKLENFSLAYVKEILAAIPVKTAIIHEAPLVDVYSWELVVTKEE